MFDYGNPGALEIAMSIAVVVLIVFVWRLMK
jgi:hypothetical protein